MNDKTPGRDALRWIGLAGAVALLLGGVSGCEASKVEIWTCTGSAFHCDAGYIPGYGYAIGVAGILGAIALAFLCLRPTRAEKVAADSAMQTWRQDGLALGMQAAERDEGKCRECGSTVGADLYFVSLVPARSDFTDPDQMVTLCSLHHGGRSTVAHVFSL